MTDYYKEGYAHIIFPLKKDAGEYPDFATERLWAKKLGQNEFQVENIPMYVRGISYGDIVEAKEVSEDVYEFTKFLKHSGHSTFRIYINQEIQDREEVLQQIIQELNAFGVKTECSKDNTLTAVDLPEGVEVSKVGQYLNDKYKAGILDYQEASVPNDYVSPKK